VTNDAGKGYIAVYCCHFSGGLSSSSNRLIAV
jgi:hypothetical protein